MQSNIQQCYPSFYTFYESHFFPGQTPVPPRSGTCIPDLSHDPIWAIWLAEVRKFHQHHDRIGDNEGQIWSQYCGCWWLDISFYNNLNTRSTSSYHNATLNSLWTSDTIWWYRTASTLVQVMACSLTTPSQYLNHVNLSKVIFRDIHPREISH